MHAGPQDVLTLTATAAGEDELEAVDVPDRRAVHPLVDTVVCTMPRAQTRHDVDLSASTAKWPDRGMPAVCVGWDRVTITVTVDFTDGVCARPPPTPPCHKTLATDLSLTDVAARRRTSSKQRRPHVDALRQQ